MSYTNDTALCALQSVWCTDWHVDWKRLWFSIWPSSTNIW